MRLAAYLKRLYIRFSGYSYTNLGRLFLRLFVSVMFLQFGVRQLYNFEQFADIFPSVCGLSSSAALILMICIEIGCSLFIMFGFLTRLMTIPPVITMVIAEIYLLSKLPAGLDIYLYSWNMPIYLPVMFIGIYCFLMLVGPGKISIDYFLSLHLIHSADQSEEELEEV